MNSIRFGFIEKGNISAHRILPILGKDEYGIFSVVGDGPHSNPMYVFGRYHKHDQQLDLSAIFTDVFLPVNYLTNPQQRFKRIPFNNQRQVNLTEKDGNVQGVYKAEKGKMQKFSRIGTDNSRLQGNNPFRTEIPDSLQILEKVRG